MFTFLGIMALCELIAEYLHVVLALLIALIMLMTGNPLIVIGSYIISHYFFKWMFNK